MLRQRNRVPSEGYTFLEMSFAELWNARKELFGENYEETGYEYTLNLDYEKYIRLTKCGHYMCIALYYEDLIVGYVGIIADSMAHNKNKLYAKIDAIYISPQHRSFTLFKQFLNVIEEKMRKFGVSLFCISSTKRRPLEKLLSRLGYKEHEAIFLKEL